MANTNDFAKKTKPLGPRTAYLRKKAQMESQVSSNRLQPTLPLDNFDWVDLVAENPNKKTKETVVVQKTSFLESKKNDLKPFEKTTSPTSLYYDSLSDQVAQTVYDQYLSKNHSPTKPEQNASKSLHIASQKWTTQSINSSELENVATEPLDVENSIRTKSNRYDQNLSGSLTELLDIDSKADKSKDDEEIDVFEALTNDLSRINLQKEPKKTVLVIDDRQTIFSQMHDSTLTKQKTQHINNKKDSFPIIPEPEKPSVDMSQILSNIDQINDNDPVFANQLNSRFNKEMAELKNNRYQKPLLNNFCKQKEASEPKIKNRDSQEVKNLPAKLKPFSSKAFFAVAAIITWLSLFIPLIILVIKTFKKS